jgi:hypothetical protein
MWKRLVFTIAVLSAGGRREAGICFTLITSKPRFTYPSEMPSARAVNERCITAFTGV